MEDKDLVYNYLKENLDIKLKKVTYGSKAYDFSPKLLDKFKNKLRTLSSANQKEIISSFSNFNPNQVAVFLENFKFNIYYKNNVNTILQTTRDIKAGRFPKNAYSQSVHSSGCINTYLGFMRALKSGTLYTDKVMIDGKQKRVFIKTPIGETTAGYQDGFFRLLIDPETMKVYSFSTTKSGKISPKLFEVYSKKDLVRICEINKHDTNAKIVEQSYLNFRKELLNKIDAVYGIERVINTYLRMGGKLDPNKYKDKQFKSEIIEYLEEKLGTEKLLKIAKKAKNPIVRKQLEKEIIETLSKKFGKEYAKIYAPKGKKIYKVKPKPLRMKRL